MRVAVSSTGKDVNGVVSDVFGRCDYFVIAEIENQKIKQIEAVENKNTNQTSGAGVSAVQLIARKNANAVITKNIGLRALDILGQFNIEVYSGGSAVAIKDVLQNFIDKKLEKIK